MATFVSCERDQAFLLPPDLKDWLPDDDLAHFVIAAAALQSTPVSSCISRSAAKPIISRRKLASEDFSKSMESAILSSVIVVVPWIGVESCNPTLPKNRPGDRQSATYTTSGDTTT